MRFHRLSSKVRIFQKLQRIFQTHHNRKDLLPNPLDLHDISSSPQRIPWRNNFLRFDPIITFTVIHCDIATILLNKRQYTIDIQLFGTLFSFRFQSVYKLHVNILDKFLDNLLHVDNFSFRTYCQYTCCCNFYCLEFCPWV